MIKHIRNAVKSVRRRIVASELRDNYSLAVDVLRNDKDLAFQIVNQHMARSAGFQAATGTEQRTVAYPALAHMGYATGTVGMKSLPKPTPYNLRRFSELPPARRAINLVKSPIEDSKWNVVPFQYVGDRNVPLTSDQRLRREVAMNCLNVPNNDISWRMLMSQVLEDLVVGGYGSIELSKTYNKLRPYFLFPVDGGSIRVNGDWKESQPWEPRYVQSYSYTGITGIGGQVIDLLDSELIYMRLHPRTCTPFGYGYLEIAFEAVNAWLGAFKFFERKASNSTPAYGIFLGEDADDGQVRQFRAYWRDQIEGYGQVPVWGGGENPQVMKLTDGQENDIYLKWQEMLIRIIATSFGLSAMAMGIERDVNRSTAGSMQTEDWSNIKPVMSLVEDYITRKFIWKALGYRDLEFRFTTRDSDEKRQADVLRLRWEADSITVNEQREVYDYDPIEEPWGSMTKTRYEAAAKAENATRPELPYMGSV